ncbi:TPA: tetratricopeptide repeat protein, partial [Candidatus Peregrinibacteria bacterium]|nr:tetratricopeptide repeat protein [Candidatus Peregrinibacteria bacterium]
ARDDAMSLARFEFRWVDQFNIGLDPEYAPHHFNYANTLCDLGRTKEALVGYTKACSWNLCGNAIAF